MKPSGSRAYRVFLFLSFASALLFWIVFTASSLYYIKVAHLDALQLVLVGTTLEAAAFLFEIPTGVLADLYSRRLSIVIGYALIGAGFLLEGTLAFFLPILLAQVLWGLGYTFTSGATQAWISDEIGETAANQAFLRSSQAGQVGSLMGVAIGSLLGYFSLRFPILLGGGFFILLAVSLALLMPEEGFHPKPVEKRSALKSMRAILIGGFDMIKKRPALRDILIIGWFFGFYSEGVDRLWIAHLVHQFTLPIFPEIVWVGLIQAVSMIISILSIEFIKRRILLAHLPTLVRIQSITTLGVIIGLIGFAITKSLFVSIFLYLVVSALREVSSPLYEAWVNTRLDSDVRATVISMSGQMNALGQIAGGPLVGLIGKSISTTAALLTSSGFLTPALLFLARSQDGKEPPPD